MDGQEHIQACKEWIARRTADLDQVEKRWDAQYNFTPPQINRIRMNEIEAMRFWIEIHRWELQQLIDEGGEYPQQTNND